MRRPLRRAASRVSGHRLAERAASVLSRSVTMEITHARSPQSR
jgi:hypothetical protein